MGLFLQDIKSHISSNGHKIISQNIMQGCPLPTMNKQRKWISIGSKSWLQMLCDTPRTKRTDIPNLVCNAMEKTDETKRKKKDD
jgi:TusA-related sulfurtransferase